MPHLRPWRWRAGGIRYGGGLVHFVQRHLAGPRTRPVVGQQDAVEPDENLFGPARREQGLGRRRSGGRWQWLSPVRGRDRHHARLQVGHRTTTGSTYEFRVVIRPRFPRSRHVLRLLGWCLMPPLLAARSASASAFKFVVHLSHLSPAQRHDAQARRPRARVGKSFVKPVFGLDNSSPPASRSWSTVADVQAVADVLGGVPVMQYDPVQQPLRPCRRTSRCGALAGVRGRRRSPRRPPAPDHAERLPSRVEPSHWRGASAQNERASVSGWSCTRGEDPFLRRGRENPGRGGGGTG